MCCVIVACTQLPQTVYMHGLWEQCLFICPVRSLCFVYTSCAYIWLMTHSCKAWVRIHISIAGLAFHSRQSHILHLVSVFVDRYRRNKTFGNYVHNFVMQLVAAAWLHTRTRICLHLCTDIHKPAQIHVYECFA